MGFCYGGEIRVHVDLLPRGPQPRRVNLQICGQIFGSFRFGNFNAVLNRSLDVALAVLVKLLVDGVGAGSKIEDNIPAQLECTESALREGGQWSPLPAVNRDQLACSRLLQQSVNQEVAG